MAEINPSVRLSIERLKQTDPMDEHCNEVVMHNDAMKVARALEALEATSTIWDRIVSDNPWLYPLIFGVPMCRFCAYEQTVELTGDGRFLIKSSHHPKCRVNYADVGDIDLVSYAGPFGEDVYG